MKFTCPECSHDLDIPDIYAGHVGTCNRCGARIKVPSGLEVKAQKVVSVATGLMDAVIPIKICHKCGVEGGRLANHFQEISSAIYCPDCAPDIVFSCPKCKEETAFKDASMLYGIHVCRKCIKKATLSCTVCGMSMVAEPSKFVEVRGVHYCNGCLKKSIDDLVTVTTTPHIDGYRVVLFQLESE